MSKKKNGKSATNILSVSGVIKADTGNGKEEPPKMGDPPADKTEEAAITAAKAEPKPEGAKENPYQTAMRLGLDSWHRPGTIKFLSAMGQKCICKDCGGSGIDLSDEKPILKAINSPIDPNGSNFFVNLPPHKHCGGTGLALPG